MAKISGITLLIVSFVLTYLGIKLYPDGKNRVEDYQDTTATITKITTSQKSVHVPSRSGGYNQILTVYEYGIKFNDLEGKQVNTFITKEHRGSNQPVNAEIGKNLTISYLKSNPLEAVLFDDKLTFNFVYIFFVIALVLALFGYRLTFTKSQIYYGS